MRLSKPGFFLPLLALYFILRGVAIQCLYPPLEGPDEYQHIAVIQYLLENRRLPVYGKAAVPVSLYDDIVSLPHPRHSFDQTERIGALTYERYYREGPGVAGNARINLYQAQHPPLYYVAMAPVFGWARSTLGFPAGVYVLRIINILAAGAALALLLYPVLRIPADRSLGRLFCIAAAASPMYMVYVSRVANDAFALLFAAAGMALALRMPAARRPGALSLCAGACTGLAVVSKLNGLMALPVILFVWMLQAALSAISWRRFAACTSVFLMAYLCVSLPWHLWAWSHYGTFLPQQEMLRIIAAGGDERDWISGIRLEHAWTFFVRHIMSHTLWTSGWSFLGLPRVPSFPYRLLILLCACGGLGWAVRRARGCMQTSVRGPYEIAMCAMLAAATLLAAYVHGLQSLALYGLFATLSYYIMIGYPALLGCLFTVALGYGRRIAAGLACAMTACFVFAELYGLLRIAVPYWSQADSFSVMFDRLASLHPAFPAPRHFFIFYFAAIVLLIAALLAFVPSGPNDRSAKPA